MKIGYLIIGRLKSTRLPKKLLIKIKGKPIITHIIDRLKLAKKIDEIIICTSNNRQDKPLSVIAKKNNVKCFFGDPDDVLVRMLGAAKKYKLDYILTITADCPFVDPNYADSIVDEYNKTNADLIRQFDLPHGIFSYGIKIDALKKVVKLKNSSDTEVWGRYFTDTGLFQVVDFEVKNNFHKKPGLRMTLDYPEDLKFFETIFDALYKDDYIFTLDEILQFLETNPDVVRINKNCGEKFLKKFNKHSEIKLKKTQSVKKVVIIGCGSIGLRHIKNLNQIGNYSIFAIRSRKGFQQKLPDNLNVYEFSKWKEIINKKPDIAIISNPTSLHLETAIKLIPFVKGIFIEKPLSNSLNKIRELIIKAKKNHTVLFMGHNLMFHPIILKIKEFISLNELGKILNIQCQAGHWIPDWHPYEDYKKSYSTIKKLGGGVSLTLIHEIQLAIEFAGNPLKVFGMKSKSSLLEIDQDVDVIADLMVKHENGCVSQIHMDYIQKPLHRSGLITFEQGWISYDFNDLKVIAQTKKDKIPNTIWHNKSYNSNDMYLKQLKCFISYVEEHRITHNYDIRNGVESLWVVDAFFNSEKKKKVIIKTKPYPYD